MPHLLAGVAFALDGARGVPARTFSDLMRLVVTTVFVGL